MATKSDLNHFPKKRDLILRVVANARLKGVAAVFVPDDQWPHPIGDIDVIPFTCASIVRHEPWGGTFYIEGPIDDIAIPGINCGRKGFKVDWENSKEVTDQNGIRVAVAGYGSRVYTVFLQPIVEFC